MIYSPLYLCPPPVFLREETVGEEEMVRVEPFVTLLLCEIYIFWICSDRMFAGFFIFFASLTVGCRLWLSLVREFRPIPPAFQKPGMHVVLSPCNESAVRSSKVSLLGLGTDRVVQRGWGHEKSCLILENFGLILLSFKVLSKKWRYTLLCLQDCVLVVAKAETD